MPSPSPAYRFHPYLIAAAAIFFYGAALADDTASSPPVSSTSASESRGVALPALLTEVGTRLHKTFILDPRASSYRIDLLSLRPQDITYPQLLSILDVYGLAVIADGTIFQVIPNASIRMSSLPLVAAENLKGLDAEFVTCVIGVKGISATQLVPLLRPMIPQWGHMAALPDRNALLIVDRTANVKRLVEIIRAFEALPKSVPPEPPKTS